MNENHRESLLEQLRSVRIQRSDIFLTEPLWFNPDNEGELTMRVLKHRNDVKMSEEDEYLHRTGIVNESDRNTYRYDAEDINPILNI